MITSIDVSQEIFAMDIMKVLKSSLKHHRKQVLRLLQLYGDQALSMLQSIVYKIHSLSTDLNRKFVQRPLNEM